MGCSNLEIVFDRDNGIYTSGEVLTGKVLASFTKPVEVRGVRLSVVGESRVKWTERHNRHHNTYTGYESYFSSEFYLLIDESGSTITIPAGNSTYPFNIQLPTELPNSFEHKYGYVRYTAKVTFDKPWKFDDAVEVPFYIFTALDLNTELEASREIFVEIEENFCCCCVNQGMVSVVVSIPTSGFVPGQTIPITLQCDNQSNIDITGVECSLRQKLKFHAKAFLGERTKDAYEVMNKETYDQPFHNNSKNPITLQLVVPLLPPSNLKNCEIIDLDYVLKIKIIPSGWRCSIVRSIPVLIGSIPLINSRAINDPDNITVELASAPVLVESFTPASQGFTDTPELGGMPQPLPIGSVTNSSQPSSGNLLDLSLPSYEECTNEARGHSAGDKTEQSTHGSLSPLIPPFPVDPNGSINRVATAPNSGKS